MKQYYEGLYFKHYCNDVTLSLIPGRSNGQAFIQIVTNSASYYIPYALSQYQNKGTVKIDKNIFSTNGIELEIITPEIELSGSLTYHNLAPIKYDIMGPFAILPMQTRHTVLSMNHELRGSLCLNGETIHFDGGKGYIEGDSGSSFPKSYVWVQCNDFKQNCSIMLSIAQIPVGKAFFWGCICVVWLEGREYRLATYKGVRIFCKTKERLEITQGKYRLVIDIPPNTGYRLAAPDKGEMVRTIYESLTAKARFVFYKKEAVLFDGASENVGFEYV